MLLLLLVKCASMPVGCLPPNRQPVVQQAHIAALRAQPTMEDPRQLLLADDPTAAHLLRVAAMARQVSLKQRLSRWSANMASTACSHARPSRRGPLTQPSPPPPSLNRLSRDM
jgi:hypothetical protein